MAYVNKNREGREFWNRLCSLPRYMFLLRPSGKGVQKLEDSTGNWIDVHDAQQIVDGAQTELAALREELANVKRSRADELENYNALIDDLATAKRNEHNSEVAYKAAIEKQEELREELRTQTLRADAAVGDANEAEQSLADAERRNAELQKQLDSIDKHLRGNVNDPDPLPLILPGAASFTTTYGLVAGLRRERDYLRQFKPTESGASE